MSGLRHRPHPPSLVQTTEVRPKFAVSLDRKATSCNNYSIEPSSGVCVDESQLTEATLGDFESAQPAIREVLERARNADYPRNPWADAAGLDLGDFLSRPLAEVRNSLIALENKVPALDATWTDGQPPLAANDLREQAINRETVAKILAEIDALQFQGAHGSWFNKGPDALRQTWVELESLNRTPEPAVHRCRVLQPDPTRRDSGCAGKPLRARSGVRQAP